MSDYRLSKTQRNEVFAESKRLDLDPAEFEWKTDRGTESDSIHRIIHVATDSFLKIDHQDFPVTGFNFDFWPKTIKLAFTQDWNGLRDNIFVWLQAVKAESDAPDLWAAASEERSISDAASVVENEAFTPAERLSLAEKLDEVKAYIEATHAVAEDQRLFLEGQFEYLKNATDRLGKRDWLNVLGSTLISLAVNQIVPADAMGNILRFTWAAIQMIFGQAPTLPPVLPPM